MKDHPIEYVNKDDAVMAVCKLFCYPNPFCLNDYCLTLKEVRAAFDALPSLKEVIIEDDED